MTDLSNRFSTHPPKDAAEAEVYALVRTKAQEFAEFVDSIAPDGREKSLAFTHIEDSMFWTNASIARAKA